MRSGGPIWESGRFVAIQILVAPLMGTGAVIIIEPTDPYYDEVTGPGRMI